MSPHVTIGTAGHVDHGKTALVKLLTGVDTDRWEEEKRRGITIDLGFAPLDLGQGLSASVVDVPGHEDFIRNMVAGAAGVDLALLVVAADEGVMPQTLEHLAILDFLGVKSGAVAITKADLVDDEWLQLVVEDVAERIAKTGIAWEIPIPCSATEGLGGDDVRQALRHAAARAASRRTDDLFRLPVDRVFSVAGAGTVVTGTSWSGSVAVGDTVRLLPGDQRSRVRGIQVHDVPQERAEPGRRTALALPDVDRSAIERGAVVVQHEAWRATDAIDVLLTLLADARPLTQRSRVRIHLGTAEVMARVTPAADVIQPGAVGAARLRLERPLVARWGDRGVVRAYSPVTTVGGVVVVDPFPARRPRRPEAAEARAERDPGRRVRTFVHASGGQGLLLRELPVRAGLDAQEIEALMARPPAGLTVLADRLVTAEAVQETRRATLRAVGRYHEDHPMDAGMPLDRLREAAASPALGHVLAQLTDDGGLVAEGSVVRLPAHKATIPPAEEAVAREIEAELDRAGRQGIEAEDPDARRILDYWVQQGTARRLRDRYYRPAVLDELIDAVVARLKASGAATPADLRDATGLTRKTLIPLLEWLDERGVTVRQGDQRVLGTLPAERR